MLKLLVLFSFCLGLFVSSDAEAGRKRRKRSGVPIALQYSKAKQKQQNRAANKHKLTRIKNLSGVKKLIGTKGVQNLVLISSSTSSYYLDKDIGYLDPSNKVFYHYSCTFVKDFLDKEPAEAHRVTGKRSKITSLTRPTEYQVKLHKWKKGAIVGSKWWQQSSHSTCAAVDISFYKLGSSGKKWWRSRLIYLQSQGQVIAVEEKNQGHFHVMVLPTYK